MTIEELMKGTLEAFRLSRQSLTSVVIDRSSRWAVKLTTFAEHVEHLLSAIPLNTHVNRHLATDLDHYPELVIGHITVDYWHGPATAGS